MNSKLTIDYELKECIGYLEDTCYSKEAILGRVRSEGANTQGAAAIIFDAAIYHANESDIAKLTREVHDFCLQYSEFEGLKGVWSVFAASLCGQAWGVFNTASATFVSGVRETRKTGRKISANFIECGVPVSAQTVGCLS